jgi:hypothetical protein
MQSSIIPIIIKTGGKNNRCKQFFHREGSNHVEKGVGKRPLWDGAAKPSPGGVCEAMPQG